MFIYIYYSPALISRVVCMQHAPGMLQHFMSGRMAQPEPELQMTFPQASSGYRRALTLHAAMADGAASMGPGTAARPMGHAARPMGRGSMIQDACFQEGVMLQEARPPPQIEAVRAEPSMHMLEDVQAVVPAPKTPPEDTKTMNILNGASDSKAMDILGRIAVSRRGQQHDRILAKAPAMHVVAFICIYKYIHIYIYMYIYIERDLLYIQND